MIWYCFTGSAQGDTSKIKAQIGLGVNSPSSNGFVSNFKGKSVNFPTVHLGVQYMFLPRLGAKLDYGFNRVSNESTSPEFKLNYTRLNLQLVYDVSRTIAISHRLGTFIHAGPGMSMVTPLGDYGSNDTSFFNMMGGAEFHYGISDKLTLFLDASYIFGFGDDFNPVETGFGSFNGDMLTVSFGVSVSLSGCYFCGD
ncbi:hypothetical protein MHTCC0001_35340 [Flavobacteriaceae bacterium MHTCC 0001]